MKNLSIILLLLILVSCSKETKDNSIENSNQQLEKIEIDVLRDKLPLSAVENKTEAVFYNSDGEELVFELTVSERIVEKRTVSQPYQAEQITINYSSPSNYSIHVQALGNYTSEGELFRGIMANISQRLTNYSTILTIDEDSSPVLSIFYESKELIDKTFENVYSNIIVPEFNEFSELYYNFQLGIIGFKNGKGDLFVLKEYR